MTMSSFLICMLMCSLKLGGKGIKCGSGPWELGTGEPHVCVTTSPGVRQEKNRLRTAGSEDLARSLQTVK